MQSQFGHVRESRRWALFCLVALGLALTPAIAGAQGVGTGTIEGKVSDESGGVMPGVTVTVSSPAMQLRQQMRVTDTEGTYRFVDLPIGVYRIQYELQGFQTFVREGLRLNAGFVARVDATLQVGSLAETVTVSGQSPVIDVSSTTGLVSFTKETLETAPTSRAFAEVLAMTPGFRPPSLDIGGSELSEQRVGIRNYGTAGQITPQLEGINTRQASGSAGFFYDYSAVEEAQVQAVGNEAEVALPGGAWNAIIKSGGNEFHGRYFAAGQHSSLQSRNVDAELRAQGVDDAGSGLRHYSDFSGDLGGRIIRNKLWFYGALHDQRSEENLIGFSKAPGGDGVFFTADDEPGFDETIVTNQTIKGTYQAAQAYKVVGFFQRNEKIQPNGQSAGRFEPFPATYDYRFPTRATKGELTGTPNDRVLFNLMFGRQWYDANRFPQEGEDRAGNPRRFDRETGTSLGPQPTQLRPRSRWQTTGSLSLFPEAFLGGDHSFKMGYQFFWEAVGTAWPTMASGDYRLIYDRVNGVPNQPVELEAYNNPVISPSNKETQYAAFLQDKWSLGQLTINMGLRWERYDAFVDEQVKEQGTFGNAGSFPRVDVLTWTAVAPRIGAAWDVAGRGKTVVKATYGWFNHVMTEDFAGNYNQNTRVTYRYRWRDLDGNNDYTPGEVDLNLNGGADFISVSGATNNILNPDLEQPVTHEVSASIERELMADFSAKALYVYKRQNNLYRQINVLRPFDVFTIPVTRQDPGPDGALGTGDDGGPITFFDYPAAYRGSAFVGNKFLNHPDDRDDDYQTIELTLNKRMSGRWDMMATYSATKNDRWEIALPQNPNEEFFARDRTWDWYAKLVGSYQLPWGIYTSAYFQHLSGQSIRRTYVFRNVPNLSTVTLPLEPFGARRLPNQNSLNWRASKRFNLTGSKRVELSIDLFNALNANTITQMTVASGPSFGAITEILPPRVVRIGGSFSF
jgi:hypothetical protein